VTDTVSLSEPRVAVMFADPAATVVPNPEPSTVTTEVEDEFQITAALKSALLPSVYVAVATNCW